MEEYDEMESPYYGQLQLYLQNLLPDDILF